MHSLIKTLGAAAFLTLIGAGAVLAGLGHCAGTELAPTCEAADLDGLLTYAVIGAALTLTAAIILVAILRIGRPRLPRMNRPPMFEAEHATPTSHVPAIDWRELRLIVRTICWSPLPMLTVSLWFGYLGLEVIAAKVAAGSILFGVIKQFF